MFQCKAHLVMRLIENRISMEFMLQVNKLVFFFFFSAVINIVSSVFHSMENSICLFQPMFSPLSLQVFNKLLSLASTASSQKYQSQMWSQMLLSTHAFLKSISNVSGKDISPLIKQWVYPCSLECSALTLAPK